MSYRTKPIKDCFAMLMKEDNGVYAVDYQPGNMTSYKFLLVPIGSYGAAAEVFHTINQGGWVFVPMPGSPWGTMFLDKVPGFVHWNYVKEKVRCTTADAVVLAEAFVYILVGTALSKVERDDDT